MPTVAGLDDDDVHALTGLRVGNILLGKYRVERLLGVGGMGAVLEATHLQLDDRVAIKILLREALEAPEAVSRFEQEARAAARIKHEHVVRVTDVGLLLLLVTTALAFRWQRRPQTAWAASAVGALATLYLVALAVAWWVMTAKVPS